VQIPDRRAGAETCVGPLETPAHKRSLPPRGALYTSAARRPTQGGVDGAYEKAVWPRPTTRDGQLVVPPATTGPGRRISPGWTAMPSGALDSADPLVRTPFYGTDTTEPSSSSPTVPTFANIAEGTSILVATSGG